MSSGDYQAGLDYIQSLRRCPRSPLTGLTSVEDERYADDRGRDKPNEVRYAGFLKTLSLMDLDVTEHVFNLRKGLEAKGKIMQYLETRYAKEKEIASD